MSDKIHWLEIETEYPKMVSKLKNFANKNEVNMDNIDKSFFNSFISENNFPKFLNIPEEFDFNTKNIETTFRGLNTFTNITIKK